MDIQYVEDMHTKTSNGPTICRGYVAIWIPKLATKENNLDMGKQIMESKVIESIWGLEIESRPTICRGYVAMDS
jgi:hypothetical protein